MRTWWIFGLDTDIPWAPPVESIAFAGRSIVFPGADHGEPACVAVAYDSPWPADPPNGYRNDLGEPRCANEEEAHRVARRFLSAIAWTHRKPVWIDFEFGSGHLMNAPRMRARGRVVGQGPSLNYLPDPPDEEGRLALAYYREGLSLNSTFYQFLSLAKVLNLRLQKGPQLEKWIGETVPKIRDPWVDHRISELSNQGVDFGDRLYKTRRCAIAHAFDANQRVDPDDPGDIRQVREDLPLIQALAEYFIEHELGIAR